MRRRRLRRRGARAGPKPPCGSLRKISRVRQNPPPKKGVRQFEPHCSPVPFRADTASLERMPSRKCDDGMSLALRGARRKRRQNSADAFSSQGFRRSSAEVPHGCQRFQKARSAGLCRWIRGHRAAQPCTLCLGPALVKSGARDSATASDVANRPAERCGTVHASA